MLYETAGGVCGIKVYETFPFLTQTSEAGKVCNTR